MTGQEFRKGLFGALQKHGFNRCGGLMCISQDAAVILVGVQKGFGEQWFVNIGFWLKQLGRDQPDRIEQSHMYLRLERLFPQYGQSIFEAGDLAAEGQVSAYNKFLSVLADEIAGDLKQLGTAEGLADAYHAGRLAAGLVTKEARELLSRTT